MDISKFLSKVIGVYLTVVSIVMITDMHHFINSINELIHNAPLMFVTGFFTFTLGILMVVSHNIWQWSWRVMITIFAWMVLCKGISIILYPEFIDKTAIIFFQTTNAAYIAAVIDLALGLLFCYFGWAQNDRLRK